MNYNKFINKITPIDYQQQQKYSINNITPFSNDRQIYMYGQMEMETPGNEEGDNDFYVLEDSCYIEYNVLFKNNNRN